MLIFHRIYLTGLWIYSGFQMYQGSEYIRVLDMSGFIKKKLRYADALTGFWLFLSFCKYQGSKYSRVTQGSQKNAAS